MVFTTLAAEDNDLWPTGLAHYCRTYTGTFNIWRANSYLVAITKQDDILQHNLIAFFTGKGPLTPVTPVAAK